MAGKLGDGRRIARQAGMNAPISPRKPIPSLVFQTWKSKDVLPANFAYWRATFEALNPRFDFRLWDDADNRRFVEDRFAWFLSTYDRFPAEIFRADVVRYLFLYEFGGVYADMDTECLRPLDHLLTIDADVVLGRMGDPGFAHSIPNAIMIARPRQSFWLLVLGLVMTEAEQGLRPEHTTGPVVLRRAVQLYGDESRRCEVDGMIAGVRERLSGDQQPAEARSLIAILPKEILYPLDWSDPIHQRFVRRPVVDEQRLLTATEAAALFPKAFMVTYWAHSWEPVATGEAERSATTS
ncbi:MAG: glycosyltransferase [Caulobacter sp.]